MAVKIGIGDDLQVGLAILLIVVGATCFAFNSLNPIDAFLRAVDYYGPVIPVIMWIFLPLIGFYMARNDEALHTNTSRTKPKKKR